jgi:hypothetical protein
MGHHGCTVSNFDVTQEKIEALILELRTWDMDEERYTVYELAKKFSLDVFIVQRIADSEDMDIPAGIKDDAVASHDADPNASTMDLDPEEIEAAMGIPDPNYEDRDTGIWEKKPTGEWELINKKG